MVVVYLIFFFKQKTAYEMRISDWSSDVCSSDLADAGSAPDHVRRNRWAGSCGGSLGKWGRSRVEPVGKRGEGVEVQVRADVFMRPVARFAVDPAAAQPGARGAEHVRSEEHTSELQSLMRISYAVFCLKKKN